jgi:endonuclease III
MNVKTLEEVLNILRTEVKNFKVPVVTLMARTRNRPFKVLISCLLSLRTKDETTLEASERLFQVAAKPHDLLQISITKLEQLIYPVGFYRVKARLLHSVSRHLIDRHLSHVPNTLNELLQIKGVGRKTANLVLTLGYGKPGICVDTHVHRISNRFGFVKTKHPDETEFALRECLPKKHWITYNDILVAYGQHLCRPTSPKCSICKVEALCDKVNVGTHR